MEHQIVSSSVIAERVLSHLGTQMSSGRELTMSQRLMAMAATAQVTSDYYGPGPAEMVVKPVELPETVKGAIAQHML